MLCHALRCDRLRYLPGELADKTIVRREVHKHHSRRLLVSAYSLSRRNGTAVWLYSRQRLPVTRVKRKAKGIPIGSDVSLFPARKCRYLKGLSPVFKAETSHRLSV